MRLLGLLLAITWVGLLGMAGFYSVKVAVADRAAETFTMEGFKRATHVLPSNSFYQLELSEYETDPNNDAEEGLRELERALALNPRETGAWIDLGLRAESAGDYTKAEKSFLTAARIDRQFEPRWRLANFYFSRGQTENFWPWAYASAEMAHDDLTPLFKLCWQVTDDANTILTRAIPDKPNIRRAYLGFLVRENRLGAAEAVAERLLTHPTREDTNNLLAYVDRLLVDSEGSAASLSTALKVWNSLANHRLIPYQALLPEEGLSLTNGDFTFSPISRGFDWRLVELPGVYSLLDKPSSQIFVTFSGKEPENCEIFYQFLPLMPAHSYRIKFSYRTQNVAPQSGLTWRISDPGSQEPLSREGIQLSSEQWKEETISFSTSPTSGLVRLVLAYQRTLGTVRIGLQREGSISLRHIRLEQGA
jgi:tetratricopeptide (TPR) repeat protein